MTQKSPNEVRIQIPKSNRNELEVLEEKSDVHILLIILVILSIPIVMGRIRNIKFPTSLKSSNDTFENIVEGARYDEEILTLVRNKIAGNSSSADNDNNFK